MLKAAGTVAAALLALALHATALHAQIVLGRVVQAGTQNGLADVHVQLRGMDGKNLAATLTDTSGSFRMHAPRVGSFVLVAERIGLARVTSGLKLQVSEEVDVELQMSESAVLLQPLKVNARSYIDIGQLAGYYERMERQQQLGFGHFVTRDQIADRGAVDVADLLRDIPRVSVLEGGRSRVPSVVFRGGRGQCTPKVYINGVLQNRGGAAGAAAVLDEMVRPHELEGIEVYRGISEMPADFYDDTHCGVVLLWTRRDTEGGRPFTWRRFIIAFLGLAAFGWMLAR